MACAFRKPIGSLTSKLIQSSAKWTTSTGSKFVCAPKLATRGLTLKRGFWCISSANTKQYTSISHKTPCGCCSIHTEENVKNRDQEMLKLLTKEIADEKKSGLAVVAMEGWKSDIDGSDVTLTRKNDDELVSVKFNVNDSVEADLDGMVEGGPPAEDQAPQMISKPLFNVLIKKKSGKVMDFACSFSQDDVYDEQDDDQKLSDQFSIVEMTIYSGDEASDSDYVLSGSTMDGMLYNMLMDMLDERGVTDDFVSDIVELSTNVEHNQYVKFLEELKTTVQE